MYIWKLAAVSPTDPRWSSQKFRGPFIIRAVGEYEARQIAQMKTFQFGRVGRMDHFSSSPWLDAEVTSATTVIDSEFPVEGESGILSPISDEFR